MLRRLRSFVLISPASLFAFVACGCRVDPDASWRQRTEGQLADIRSGERHTVFCPYPGMLLGLAEDPNVAMNLTEVRSWGDVSSPDFAHLADLPKLESVSLYDAHGVDAFLKHLLACKAITRISVDQTDLSDAGLATIGQMSTLRDVAIGAWDDRISAEGLNQLASLKTLRKLWLRVGPSTPNLDAIRSALPDCDIRLEVDE